MQQTLPKSIILRGYQSFTTVITGGLSFHGTMLTAYLLLHEKGEDVRIGFSVPKRQIPLAAHRNRIRRLMKEAVRKNFFDIREKARERRVGADIVLMFRRNMSTDIRRLVLRDLEPSWQELRERILHTL